MGSEVVAALAAYEFGVPLAGAKRSVPNIAGTEVECWARCALRNLHVLNLQLRLRCSCRP